MGNGLGGFVKAAESSYKAFVINDFMGHFDINPSTMEYEATPRSPEKVSEIVNTFSEDNKKTILEKFDIDEKKNTAVRKK